MFIRNLSQYETFVIEGFANNGTTCYRDTLATLTSAYSLTMNPAERLSLETEFDEEVALAIDRYEDYASDMYE